MALTSRYVWLDGRLVDSERATLPFLTAALHYGAAVYEGIRAYPTDRGPAVFRLADHIDRLLASAKVLGFRDLPFGAAALIQAVKDTVSANNLSACYIRPLIYLAEGGWNLNIDTGTPGVGIAAWAWNDYLSEDARRLGIRANVSSFSRHHPNAAMTKAKITGNYADSVMAKTESVRLGFDEAVMLDPHGYVAECTGQNIFVVRQGRLATPPAAAILPGITRDTVMTLAADMHLAATEEPITRDQLYMADEVFICGTAAELVGVREIDFRTIGKGTAGPVTLELQDTFREVTLGRHHRSDGWLDPVHVTLSAGETPVSGRALVTPLQGPGR